MKIDEAIKNVETYADRLGDKELKQIAKWLKELKRLREKVRHCELVHGTVFEELEKKGIIA